MSLKIVIECLKAITVGALIGLLLSYFADTNPFKGVFIFGFLALSIHAKNNTHIKNK